MIVWLPSYLVKTLTSMRFWRRFSTRRSAGRLRFFDFALETGDEEPLERARSLIASAVSLADNAENVPLWWITNLCRHLIDDLWEHSLHQNLPTQPPEGRSGAVSRSEAVIHRARSMPGKPRKWSFGRPSVRRPAGPRM